MKKLLYIFVFAFFLIGCTTNADVTEGEPEDVEEVAVATKDSEVVTIGDKTFDEDDFAFYTLMNQVKLELEIAASESKETDTYLEEQKTYYENVNVNLQSMIELYGMSLLAMEKNYFVPDDKLIGKVEAYKGKVTSVKKATELVEEFGEEKFNRNIEEYIRQVTLRDRIAGELEEEIIEENPDMDEAEISYTLENKYEDLLMGQMYTLEMEIHLE